MRITSEVQAITAPAPVLGLLAKDSPDKTEAFIELCILDLLSFLNVNRTMNEMQIKETSRLLVQRYNYLKISDVKLVFDRIKTGKVKLFEGIDGMKILSAFENWIEQRQEVADDYNYQKHRDITGDEKKRREKPFAFGSGMPHEGEIPDEKYFEKKTA